MDRLKLLLKRMRPSGRRGWLRLVTLVLIWSQLLAFVGAFSPFLSWAVYPRLAPNGWHNITPHGHIILNEFAASTSSPGLMLACGTSWSIDLRDPSTLRLGGLRFWLSRDGGASWWAIYPPLGDDDQCGVGLSPDGALFVSETKYPRHNYITWMSHDAGKTWQHESPNPTVTVDGKSVIVVPMVRRGNTLYGFYTSNDAYSDEALAVSADDGAHWTLLGTTPSALIQQGWQIGGDLVPDYRNDHWWYRTLYVVDKPPMLEHSTDDGRSWAAVGPIGSGFTGEALLSASPSQPGWLCADHSYSETDHVSLFASTDGGITWRAGAMPASLQHTSGDTSEWPRMDAGGACYQGYHFGGGGLPSSGSAASEYVFLRLTPDSETLQSIPVAGDGEASNVFSDNITYVPAGNGMSARLVIQSSIEYHSWAAVFSGLAGETSDGQILWTTVP